MIIDQSVGAPGASIEYLVWSSINLQVISLLRNTQNGSDLRLCLALLGSAHSTDSAPLILSLRPPQAGHPPKQAWRTLRSQGDFSPKAQAGDPSQPRSSAPASNAGRAFLRGDQVLQQKNSWPYRGQTQAATKCLGDQPHAYNAITQGWDSEALEARHH